ncbi:hypothetical protein ACWGB8_12890 [Kitasatospora sp. NPDC054939]
MYDDGRGKVLVSVGVTDDVRQEEWACYPQSRTCPELLDDGTAAKVQRIDAVNTTSSLRVVVRRNDGREVWVKVANTDRLHSPTALPPTRADLAFTVDQLRAIALSPHWRR